MGKFAKWYLYFASCIEEGLHRSIEYDPIEFGD